MAPQRDRLLVLADALVVLWVVAWLVIGLRVGAEADGLRDLGGSVQRTGAAIERTGEALATLGELPVVGRDLGEVATGVTEAGRNTRRSGLQARDSAGDLGTLLTLVVALIPSSALLIPYVPLRIRRVRDRRALAELERRFGDDPHLERLLAHRGLHRLGYHQLHAMGGRPWAELADGDTRRLADAERARVGLPMRNV